MSKITFSATGDSFIVRRIPGLDSHYQDLVSVIQEADVRFTNLETVIRNDEGFPSAQSGGTWASSPPEVLEDLIDYGFNMVAWANNHTLDYSYGGLESTADYLDCAGLIHAGAGENLAEAGAIRFLDLPQGRVALIAATSSFHPSWIAGAQRADGPGRPGVNPLRYSIVNHVSEEQLQELKKVAESSGINREHELRVKEGFALAEKEGVFRFGEHLFSVGDGSKGQSTRAHQGDLKRIQKTIQEASRRADIVLVSIHAHESEPGHKDRPAEFLVEFARSCVDAGAHAIIGHGPHILRGIEIYRDRPIFYSLGNFIFQNESVGWQPADFYEKYHLDPELGVSEVFNARSANGTRGLGKNPKVWHSLIANWSMADGKLSELVLHPITLGYGLPAHRIGVPQLFEGKEVIEEIQQLSQPFGTSFQIENNKAVWRA